MASVNSIVRMTPRKKPPLPLDRGWAWLIMLTAYINVMIAVAFGRSLSILLPAILDHYQKPAAVTTLAFGCADVTWSLANIAIPTVLLPRFGVRRLTLIGAFFHSLSLIALAYSPNIIIFNCIFGVIGFAGGLMLVPPLIHLGHFFRKRLSFASAFTQAGGSTATVIVPMLMQFLQDRYGFQGALLILGGINFNCVAVSLLLRPLSMYDNVQNTKTVEPNKPIIRKAESSELIHNQAAISVQEDDDEHANEMSKFLEDDKFKTREFNEINRASAFVIKEWTDESKGNFEDKLNKEIVTNNIPIVDVAKSVSATSIQNIFPDAVILLPLNNKTGTQCMNAKNSLPVAHSKLPQQNNEAENKFCFTDECKMCGNNVQLRIHDSKECTHQTCYHNLQTIECKFSNEDTTFSQVFQNCDAGSRQTQQPKVTIEPVCRKSKCWKIHKFRSYIRSTVLLNPVAVMLILAGGLSTPGGSMYLPVLGLENGLLPEEVPWMLTIIGISDIVGKLAIGYFADLGYLRPIRIVCFTQLSVGVMFQFTNFYRGFGPMAAVATVYGLTAGIIQALLTPMIVQMVGLSYLAQVMSIFYLATGICTFVLNVTVGAIRDASGSFAYGYNFIGGMVLTSLFLLLLEPVFIKCRDRRQKSDKNGNKAAASMYSDPTL